jgi:hypothetical protein
MKQKQVQSLSYFIVLFIIISVIMYFFVLSGLRIGIVDSVSCWTSVTGVFEHEITVDRVTGKSYEQCVGSGIPLYSLPIAGYFSGYSLLLSIILSFFISLGLWKIYDIIKS